MTIEGARRWRSWVRLLAYFFGLCAAALAVAAVMRWRTRSIIVSEWPKTTATVRRCAVHQHRSLASRRSGSGGTSFWVACDVSYEVADHIVEAHVLSKSRNAGSSGTLFTFRDGRFVTDRPGELLEAWRRKHPPGSVVTLRYDPSAPETATFVGAEPALDDDPMPGSIAGAGVFALAAVVAAISAGRIRDEGG